MSKKTGVVVALAGMCALSVFLVSCGSSSSRPSALLYVTSQAESNVSSYAIDLNNGNLSLINSNLSPTCPTAPCGVPLSISLDPTGATAFVLNQLSISGYTIGSDGNLSAPSTVATLPQAALAMTRDAGGNFIFLISPGVTSPTDCPDTNGVYGADCPTISVFTTTPGSTSVTPGEIFPLNRVPTALSVITFTPAGGSAETLLFVTSSHDLTGLHNDNELSVYAVDSAGNLTEQPDSPYTAQANPTSVIVVNTNPVGTTTGGIFVYVGTQNGSGPAAASEFQLCTSQSICSTQQVANNDLLKKGSATMTTCQYPVAMLTDPTNSFLYIACNVSNTVYAFRMVTVTGSLTPLVPALQPTGANPVALAMHPNFNAGAEFLFVSNLGGSSVTAFNVAVSTGTLSGSNTVLFPPGEPSGIAGR